MTYATARSTGVPAAPTAGGGGWADLAWLIWRQHRGLVIVSTVLALACSAVLLTTTVVLDDYDACRAATDTCYALHGTVIDRANLQVELLAVLPALVAAFWGAPLVTREYEQGTLALAWGQDVSPARWLLRKAALLGAVATGLALVVGLCARPLTDAVLRVKPASGFDRAYFEAGEPMIAAYTVLALAAGIAAGTLLRRTLPAIAAGLAGFAAIRLGLALFARPHYLPPSHVTAPLTSNGPTVGRNALLLVNDQYGTAAGSVRAVPGACSRVASNLEDFYRCLRGHGITNRISVFQPASRLPWFQIIEAGLCLIVAAALLGFALHRVRRHHYNRS
jgi:hypothetical protein